MAITPTLLTQAQAKKVCRLTKWLLNTQNKLRTAIKGSSTTTSTSTTKKSCSHTGNKATQQRRIHNEIFGWTSDAWDEMSLVSPSTTTTPLFSPAPTTPQTRSMSREEALRRADDYTIRRIENAYMHNTVHNSSGRRVYFRVEGY
ncbi:unnamed protein product [Aureobasidium mustum]|uniref:Uncharacterized protein n=1 Tax=Aureobasidium mustum TaxID=2773714 RepID=A0A9N8PJE1_9PEZI|nr:unnamed protein product [Aureobasidium mustum]